VINLLEIQNLKVHFPVQRGLLGRTKEFVRAVDDVSFSLAPGETVGLVGESGCGKTTLGRAVIKLVEPTAGRIFFDGENIADLSGKALRARRRRFQMIFQDPYSSLNPRRTVSEIIGEALDIHRLATGPAARRQRIEALLQDVGLDPSHAQRYPHEFSGGQRQRIGIARALAVEPKLIVCDEPVSALDVSVQAQIINLLKDLQREHGIAYLFIAHDLAVVEHISHRLLVMYLGRLVEAGEARSVCRAPRHPYTQALLSAVPVVDPDAKRQRIFLAGEVPSPIHPPGGCPFHPRCPLAEARCQTDVPALREIEPGRWAACHLLDASRLSGAGQTSPAPQHPASPPGSIG
jgi:oligopeptide/dipeptide ABC transporter ATP-binding protein